MANREFLPLVETTSNRNEVSVALCSSYVLKDKTRIKTYLPLQRILENYAIMKKRPSSFQLSTGLYIIEVWPNDVIEIIEQ